MPKNSCIMQIRAEPEKSALPICNYSQILYQFLTFTQSLKLSRLFKNFFEDLFPEGPNSNGYRDCEVR